MEPKTKETKIKETKMRENFFLISIPKRKEKRRQKIWKSKRSMVQT